MFAAMTGLVASYWWPSARSHQGNASPICRYVSAKTFGKPWRPRARPRRRLQSQPSPCVALKTCCPFSYVTIREPVLWTPDLCFRIPHRQNGTVASVGPFLVTVHAARPAKLYGWVFVDNMRGYEVEAQGIKESKTWASKGSQRGAGQARGLHFWLWLALSWHAGACINKSRKFCFGGGFH